MKSLAPALLLLALLATPAAARKSLAPPCAGRFLVRDPPFTSGTAPEDEPLVIGNGRLAIDNLCLPVRAAMKNRKHGTSLAASFKTCPGLGARGRAKVQATVDRGCSLITGLFVARKARIRRRFTADLSVCGDGIVDTGNGEQCDGGGCGVGEGCTACACEPAPTTTVSSTSTTSTSTSTTTTSTTTTLPRDGVPPVLLDFSVSPLSVDTAAGAAAVAVHVEAQDDATGFGVGAANGSITALHESSIPEVVLEPLPLTGGTSLHATFDFTLTFPQFSKPGSYGITLTLTDRGGNLVTFSPADLGTRGFPSAVTAMPFPTPTPAIYGQWGSVMTWPKVAIHVNVLPSGKVMFWDTDSQPQLWDPVSDPASNDIGTLALPGYDIFCSGYSFLADGRLFVTGGNIDDGIGLPTAAIYNPFTDAWTREPDMNAGRWYPTNTTLANGDVLTVAGSYWDGTFNLDGTQHVVDNMLPQVFQTASSTWRDLTTAVFDLPLYPFMYLTPNGRVFAAGWMPKTRYIDTTATGTLLIVGFNTFGNRDRGSSVMYDDGRVLVFGGSAHTTEPPTETAEVIDLNAGSPVWRAVAPMARPRRHVNGTILPDGTVLATGGTSAPGFNNALGSELTAELWNPTAETWSTMAPMQVQRLYHSTAALLPDGRVLAAGGGHPSDAGSGDTHHFDAEIFSPPYLFRGPRPTISSAPTRVTFGQSFLVTTPNAAAIAGVTWIRLSSVTHSFNQNQRINRLAFERTAGAVQVTAPSDANRCPPGHYILFLLDGSGVPSVGRIVEIGS